MPKKERSTVEKLANLSKKIDIGTAIAGLIIGGNVGLALILWSGATYVAADIIEKSSKKKG
jgi:hypothetical protein